MHIEFSRFTLENGLRVVVHQQEKAPVVACNLLYEVGAKDESPDKTGFAHLFEHLMFGGSKHIPSYDTVLENVGGVNNAFTSNDITNYYLVLPKVNLETAFWLESDRMLELDFSQRVLDVQKRVVVEEYNQRYLNQPYGDAWLLIRSLAYKMHPYRWPVIGEDISHIERAELPDVKDFFYRFYKPENAILSISGDVSLEQIQDLSAKWFGDIPARGRSKRTIIPEPPQERLRQKTVQRDVPAHMLFLAFHMPSRLDPDYYTVDMLSDVLSHGKSSRLYQALVKSRPVFSDIQAWISGDHHPGLFMVAGRLLNKVDPVDARDLVLDELEKLKIDLVSEEEMKKVKNKFKSSFLMDHQGVLPVAMSLGLHEALGDAEGFNQEIARYDSVTPHHLRHVAQSIFLVSNRSELWYLSNHQK